MRPNFRSKSILLLVLLGDSSHNLQGNNNLISTPFTILQTEQQKEDFINNNLIKNEAVVTVLDEIYFSVYSSTPKAITKYPGFTSLTLKKNHHLIGQVDRLPLHILKMVQSYSKKERSKHLDARDSNIYRVVEAQRFQECIRKNNLNRLIIPEKKLYHIPHAPWVLNDKNFVVVVEKLPILPFLQNRTVLQNLSMEDIEIVDQLFTFIVLTGFDDPYASNIRCLYKPESNKLFFAFIDTEPLQLARKKKEYLRAKAQNSYIESVKRGLYKFQKYLRGGIKKYWNKKFDAFLKQYRNPSELSWAENSAGQGELECK